MLTDSEQDELGDLAEISMNLSRLSLLFPNISDLRTSTDWIYKRSVYLINKDERNSGGFAI